MKELTPEEKLEARFYEVGRRIAEFDPIHNSVHKIEYEVIVLKDQFSKYKTETILRTENLERINASLSNALNKINEKIDQLGNELSFGAEQNKKLSFRISQLERDRAIDVHISQEQDKKIADLHSSFTDQKSTNKNFFDQLYALMELVANLKDKVLDLPDYKDIIDLTRQDLQHTKTRQDSLFKEMKSEVAYIRNDVNEFVDKKYSYLDSVINSISQKLENHINSFPKVSSPDVVTKDSWASLLHQLDAMALDIKNALLKSSNNEMQNNLNLKKIENIQLILKQYELSK